VKRIAILALAAVAGIASADIDHSQLINLPFGGTGAIAGAHVSQLETGETIFGYGFQAPPTNNIMADDFTVGAGGFTVTGISVFGYTTGATAPSITAVGWAIGAAPSTTLTTSAVPSAWWSSGGQAVYRTTFSDTTSSNRRIQVGTVTGLNIFLAAGTHFLSFQAAGVNFTPPLPTSLATHGMNAQQSIAGGAFAPAVNGPGGADAAFIIHGQAVPEPGSMIALGLGAAALAARRRRNKK
jgi:hypothetical protein